MESATELAKLRAEFEIEKQIAFKSGQLQSDVTVWSLLQSIAEGVIMVDENARILLVNPQMQRILGFSQADLMGKSLDVLIPERYRAGHQGMVGKFFREPRIRPMGSGINLTALSRSGEEVPVEISLSFLQTNIGGIGLAFISDISTRKRIEDSLRQQNQELDIFARSVAHNLNNTISGMVGACELLKQEEGNDLSAEEREEYLTILHESGKKMSDVVRDLLLFARVRSDEVQLEPVNVNVVIDSIKLRLAELLKSLGGRIVNKVTDNIALGYRGWLEEVLYNLVSNAIKYGGVPPMVTISSEIVSLTEIAYHITDNGPGLSEHDLKVVLAEQSPERQALVRGHGLGIPIAKNIVAKLSGRLEARSNLGNGTTFSVVLRSVTPQNCVS